MTSRQSVFLCGFMGSGKSSLGFRTAELLGLTFFDLDEYIEEKEHTQISELFAKEGESFFRNKETFYLKELLENASPCLIALGGGTVCYNNNLEYLKSKGLLVYLEASPATLSNRLKHTKKKRPLLEGLNDEQRTEQIRILLEKRKSFYEAAHLKVNALNLNAEHLKNEISRMH